MGSPSHDTASPGAPCAEAGWTPLRQWRPPQLEAIADHIAQASLDWSRGWTGCAGAAAEQAARDAVEAAPHVADRSQAAPLGLPLHAPGQHGDAARAWLGCAAGRGGLRGAHPAQALRRILCGDPAAGAPDSIAEELGDAALLELADALRAALALEGGADATAEALAELPAADFHAWSGAVRVNLPVAGELVLYLNGACAQRLAPQHSAAPAAPGAPLQPVSVAARQHALRLQARLHGVDLSLGHLKSLAVGDVVVLPHALEEALVVVTEHGAPVCRAYLGQQHARRALELIHGQEPGGVPV